MGLVDAVICLGGGNKVVRSCKNKGREKIKRAIRRRMCRIHVSMGYSLNRADREGDREGN